MSAAAQRAEARRAEREARLATQRSRLRLRVAAAVAAVVIVVGSCVAVWNSPLFAIERVEVAGAGRATEQRVRALARVPAGATLLRFPAAEVEERVSKDPFVESVTVSRVFPDAMRIRVVERTPAAVVESPTGRWLVDGRGWVMAKVATASVAAYKVPSIRDVPGLDPRAGRRTTSEPLLNALAVLTGISRQLAAQVVSVSAPSIDGATLLTRTRIEIVMGEASELRVKDTVARGILSEQRGKVVSVDVRDPQRATWRGLK